MMILQAHGAAVAPQSQLMIDAGKQPVDARLRGQWEMRPEQLAGLLNQKLGEPPAGYVADRVAAALPGRMVQRVRHSIEQHGRVPAACVRARPATPQHWVVVTGTTEFGVHMLDPWPLIGFPREGPPSHTVGDCICHQSDSGNCRTWLSDEAFAEQLRGAAAPYRVDDALSVDHVFAVLSPPPPEAGGMVAKAVKALTGIFRRSPRRRPPVSAPKADAGSLRALLSAHRLGLLEGPVEKGKLICSMSLRRPGRPDALTFAVLKEGAQFSVLWLDAWGALMAFVQPDSWPGLPERGRERDHLLKLNAALLVPGRKKRVALSDFKFTVEEGPLLPPEPAAVHPGWPSYRLSVKLPDAEEPLTVYAGIHGNLLIWPPTEKPASDSHEQ